MLNDVERCCLLGRANDFNTSPTVDSTNLHERPGIQSQAAGAVVTMDTDIDTYVIKRPIGSHAQRASTSFQHVSTLLKGGGRGGGPTD